MSAISKREAYKTVEKPGEAVFIDRKSKFIAHTKPVKTEQEALDFLQEMRSEYSDANHNVYAYVIAENNIFRYSDDGEPGGTAGMPVLDTLRKDGIVDVITVVTRYFGGTLLGTGGLVHAYTAAASESLENAGKITRILCDVSDVTVDYSLSGKVQYLIATKGYFLEKTDYSETVTFTVCTEKKETAGFEKELSEACAGRAAVRKAGERYIDKKLSD